jgi:magnesium chelatase family protein
VKNPQVQGLISLASIKFAGNSRDILDLLIVTFESSSGCLNTSSTFFTDPNKECTCNSGMIQRYMSKISGPLLDRIDIHIEVPAVKYKDLSSVQKSESSSDIRKRVVSARNIQTKRYADSEHIYNNADIGSKEVREYCRLGDDASKLLKMAMTKLGLSARAYDRILKVSRTIADLEYSNGILPNHVSEAIQYRSLDRELWNH